MRPLAVTGLACAGPPGPGQDGLVVRQGLGAGERDAASLLSDHVPSRMRRRMTRLARMVCSGALSALEDAGLADPDAQASVASVFGTAYGEIDVACRLFEQGLEPGLSPTAFHNSVHNAPLGYLSIFSGLRGPSLSLSDSTLSGEESLAVAALLLEEGAASAVVAGAGDESCPSIFSPCWRQGEDAPRVTARSRESDDRLVTDEGCGFLVVERLEDARARKAGVHAVIESVVRARDIGEALRATGAGADLVMVPAGLDRAMDPVLADAVRRAMGADVRLGTEGDECGYVPASGAIRAALAIRALHGGPGTALVCGEDLDGHAAVVRMTAPGGG
jgi:3-oxoacyl-(acyl-carrier-protein) synthase